MGTERGSRVLRRVWDVARGFDVAMAEAMMLVVGEAGCGMDAERSICGTSARADLAGESGSEGVRHGEDDMRVVSGSDVKRFAAGSNEAGLSRIASAGISTYSNVAIVVERSELDIF